MNLVEFRLSAKGRSHSNTKAFDSIVGTDRIFLVAGLVVVEVNAVEALASIHEAQLLTYLRVGGWKVGLLINFNVLVLKDGICRKFSILANRHATYVGLFSAFLCELCVSAVSL